MEKETFVQQAFVKDGIFWPWIFVAIFVAFGVTSIFQGDTDQGKWMLIAAGIIGGLILLIVAFKKSYRSRR
jgi:hypothetical protein